MAGAWEGKMPDHVFRLLNDGDLLAFQNFGSVASWMIMYGSSSFVSHIGTYGEGGKIIHMTPPHFVIEPIADTFHEDVRVLPIRMLPASKKHTNVERALRARVGEPYGYTLVLRKAWNMVSGRYWPIFRWKFFFDVCLVVILLDLIILGLFGFWGVSWIAVAYLAVILFNRVRWHFDPVDLSEGEHGYPEMAFHVAAAHGGIIVGDAYAAKDNPAMRQAGTFLRPVEMDDESKPGEGK
jgi:hypothetical protein